MADKGASLLGKTTELETDWCDSRMWNGFPFRQDDIVIDTFPKCGTTWVQQIVGQLIFNGQEKVNIKELSLWLDFRYHKLLFGYDERAVELLEKQTHRRFIKTHLPFNALVYSPDAKYLFVVRDGRDAACSMYNHLSNVTVKVDEKPTTLEETFQSFILGTSESSFFPHVRSAWDRRHLPNVLLIHFRQLKKDLPKEIQRIAQFLDIAIDPSRWEAIVKHCSFDYMRKNGDHLIEEKLFVDGAKTFFCQGTNDRWKGLLSDEDSAIYERRAVEELGEEGARWLATGELTNEQTKS